MDAAQGDLSNIFRPARVDDLIEVHTTAHGAHRRAHDGRSEDLSRMAELLVHGRVEACIITLTGKPRRIPDEMRDKLAPFVVYETDT